MLLTTENVVLVLLIGSIGFTLALPSDAGEHKDVSIADAMQNGAPKGRIPEPVLFAVKKKRYTIGTSGVGTFFRAWRNCIEEGKSLATIDSQEEQNRLAALVDGHNTQYWIAATNLGNPQGALTWITTDLPVSTTPATFMAAQGTCVTVGANGAWSNNGCLHPEVVFPYVCEGYF